MDLIPDVRLAGNVLEKSVSARWARACIRLWAGGGFAYGGTPAVQNVSSQGLLFVHWLKFPFSRVRPKPSTLAGNVSSLTMASTPEQHWRWFAVDQVSGADDPLRGSFRHRSCKHLQSLTAGPRTSLFLLPPSGPR